MHPKGAMAAGLMLACSLSAGAAEFKVSDDVTFNAGLGLRASYSRRDFGAPDGNSKSNDFSVESARLFAERASDLRDALLEVRPDKEGIDAELWVRFLAGRKSAGR